MHASSRNDAPLSSAMQLTHLARKGSQALRIKIDIEAAVVSCSGDYNNGSVSTSRRSAFRLTSRLRMLLANSKDLFAAKSLVHGYMFDAWSSRQCADQFLSLNAPWILKADEYLDMTVELELRDYILPCLSTVSRLEKLRLLSLLVKSRRQSLKGFEELLLWSIDETWSVSLKTTEPAKEIRKQSHQRSLLNLWTDLIREEEHVRLTFLEVFKNVMGRVLVRLSDDDYENADSSSLLSGSVDAGRKKAGDELSSWMSGVVAMLLEDRNTRTEIDREHSMLLSSWSAMIATRSGGTSQASTFLETNTRSRKRSHETSSSIGSLDQILTNDSEFAILCKPLRPWGPGKSVYTHPNAGLTGHCQALIDICYSIILHQEAAGIPPKKLSRVALEQESAKNTFTEGGQLKSCRRWIESTIAAREGPWRSCVKLKLQFYAVFEEESIHEEFADLVSECGLHWELCATLQRYLKRHHMDNSSLPLNVLQLGCELLLSVYTKKELLWNQLRDHLYGISRSLHFDVSGPLFGSWDFWRLDIDTQLVATLNQLVALKKSSSGFAIPSHVKEALIKISLIAPYHVLLKIVEAASMNRGQCPLLLTTLLDLGQLAWLRATTTEPALLATVIHDIICEVKGKLTWTPHQLDNFAEFVFGAITQSSPARQPLLDRIEFLVECAVPLLERMNQYTGSDFSKPIAAVLTKIYETVVPDLTQSQQWLYHEIHATLLLNLLDLCNQQRPKMLGELSLYVQKRGGSLHFEDLSRLCSLIVSVLTDQVRSSSTAYVSHQVRALWSTISVLQELPLYVGSASQLVALPLLRACGQHMSSAEWKPVLDHGLSILCGDNLQICKISPSKTESKSTEEFSAPAQATLILLHYSSLCSIIAEDLIQAVKTTSKDIDPQYQLLLKSALIPGVYRVLSTCSSQESQRLLVRVVPALMESWGGFGTEGWRMLSDDDGNGKSSFRVKLGPYWNEDRISKEGSPESKEGMQATFSILSISESLLRLAMDPYPRKLRSAIMSVYSFDVGYDMLVDQVASLVPTAVKSLQQNWSQASLDYVLYCFLLACNLCHICTEDREPTMPSRIRIDCESVQFCADYSDEEILSAMEDGDSKGTACLKATLVESQARACAELLLMAMNISAEIVARQDVFYQDHKPLHDNTRTRRGKYKNRQRSAKYKSRMKTKSLVIEPTGEDPQPAKWSLDLVQDGLPDNIEDMDEATMAWKSTVMGLASKPSEQELGDPHRTDVNGTNNTVEAEAEGPISTQATSDRIRSPSRLLNADQVNCLRLAISHLPPQERQAVQRRLERLLQEDMIVATTSTLMDDE